jgi:hypothetical protein
MVAFAAPQVSEVDRHNHPKYQPYGPIRDQTGTPFADCTSIMNVDEMIAEEIDESGNTESAELPLEVELDKKGAYSISGTLPRAPGGCKHAADLQVDAQ